MQSLKIGTYSLFSFFLFFVSVFFVQAAVGDPLAQPSMSPVQCNASGTTATLSWGAVPGAEVYPVRYRAPSLTSCPSGWFSATTGECDFDTGTATSISVPVTPGIAYQWWVHAKYASTWAGASPFTLASFSCPAPTLPQPAMAPVQCAPGGTSATLSWAHVPGTNYSAVRYSGTSVSSCPSGWFNTATGECSMDDTQATSVTVPTTPGATYKWWVHAKYPGSWTGLSGFTQVSFSCPAVATLPQPTMAAVQCNAAGTLATLSWGTVSGSGVVYSPRYKGSSLSSCPSGWYSATTGECDLDDSSLTSMTVPVTPGAAYQWWVHAKYPGTWAGISGATLTSFSCAAPLPGYSPVTLGNWTGIAGTVVAQSGIVTVTEDTTNTSHGMTQYVNVGTASPWQFSFEAHGVGARNARVYLADSNNQSNAYAAAQCELTGNGRIISQWNGSATTAATTSATKLADGWYRCVIAGNINTSTPISQLRLTVYTEKSGSASYLGDGISGLQLRNVQLAGVFPAGTAPTQATLSSPFVQSLFALREGYGANTTGGLNGDVYTVTNLNNSGPGSLRFAAEDPSGKAYWIQFAPSLQGGTLALTTPINVGPNKTIDGRGRNITITGHGFNIGGNYGSGNVIISGLAIRNVVSAAEDNISIYGVQNVWIHRTSLSGQGSDGLIDITDGATDVTIDWSRFTDHDHVMIINSYPTSPDPNNPNGEIVDGHALDYYDRDKNARVTLHHNVFDSTTQRHPRAVFGKVHMYNNVLKNWGAYGVGSSFRAQTLAEGNVFDSSGQYANKALVNQVGVDPEPGFIKAINNLFLGSASGASSGASSVFTPPYQYRCEQASAALESKLLQQAGVEGTDGAITTAFSSGCPAL